MGYWSDYRPWLESIIVHSKARPQHVELGEVRGVNIPLVDRVPTDNGESLLLDLAFLQIDGASNTAVFAGDVVE